MIFFCEKLEILQWIVSAMYVLSINELRRCCKNFLEYRIIKFLIGFFYISFSFFSIVSFAGKDFMLFFIIITLTDTFAYFGGKAIGGPKLAPQISPGKTWSGLFCGVFGCVSFLIASYKIFDLNFFKRIIVDLNIKVILNIIFVSVCSQIGDLLASLAKRKAKIKDFGNIMPGHGGVLDRLDGLIFVFFVYGIICFAFF